MSQSSVCHMPVYLASKALAFQSTPQDIGCSISIEECDFKWYLRAHKAHICKVAPATDSGKAFEDEVQKLPLPASSLTPFLEMHHSPRAMITSILSHAKEHVHSHLQWLSIICRFKLFALCHSLPQQRGAGIWGEGILAIKVK